MGRPRTPTNVLDARGSFKKHPERQREDAEAAGALGEPPEYFSDEQLGTWSELIAAAPRDVITESDRFALELAAVMLAQFRNDPAEFPATKLVRLEALLGKFGMTPADRARIGGRKEKPKGNPFGDL